MPDVPANLRMRFERWDAEGRPQQKAFAWERSSWQRYLGGRSILDTLPNPIDRADVLKPFQLVNDLDSALDAYIANYVWGYAQANFGPWRAERVIRLNTDLENGKNFAAELETLAGIAMTDGGNPAFQHIVGKR